MCDAASKVRKASESKWLTKSLLSKITMPHKKFTEISIFFWIPSTLFKTKIKIQSILNPIK
jgi:hypothetical protein